MNINKFFRNKIKNLKHKSHGGEIFKAKFNHSPNSLIDFSTNINPLPIPKKISQIYINSINLIAKYPDSKSIFLQEELLRYFNKMIKEDNIIIGAGSTELITLFCDVFIELGDDIIIVQPTFSEYMWATQKNGGNTINVFRRPENQFQIEPELIIEKISLKTKIIFICNPNNPNGLLDPREKIEMIIKFASKRDILIFLDEAFIDFTGESNSFVQNISSYDNLYISRTFTKFFGIPGLRIGFGVSTPEIINYLVKAQNLWSVNCIGQLIAKEMLKSDNYIQKSLDFFSKERQFMKEELKSIKGLKVFPTDTNYFLINTINTGITSMKIKENLLKENILVRDCSNYEGLNNYYFRVCIKERNFNVKLINSLKKIILSQ